MLLARTLLLLVIVSGSACTLSDRGKQVRALTSLQDVSQRVLAYRRDYRALPSDELFEEWQRDYKDPWGQEPRYFQRDGRFCIVHPGKDGVFEASSEAYWTWPESDIKYFFDKDLVIVDGKLLTKAGK